MCLSSTSGKQFSDENLQIVAPLRTSDGRANISASVIVNCVENGKSFTGEITVGGVGQNIPLESYP